MVLEADLRFVPSKARQILFLIFGFTLSSLYFSPVAADVFQDRELVCSSQNSENTCRLQQAHTTYNLSGYHAGFQLDAQLLLALKSGVVLTATLMDTKSSQIDVSQKGFSSSLSALSAQRAKP